MTGPGDGRDVRGEGEGEVQGPVLAGGVMGTKLSQQTGRVSPQPLRQGLPSQPPLLTVLTGTITPAPVQFMESFQSQWSYVVLSQPCRIDRV